MQMLQGRAPRCGMGAPIPARSAHTSAQSALDCVQLHQQVVLVVHGAAAPHPAATHQHMQGWSSVGIAVGLECARERGAVWVRLRVHVSVRACVRGAGPLIADGFDDGVERRVFPEVQVGRGHLNRSVAGGVLNA